ncbi:hypothetical protein [Shewanella sp. FJAT-52076]|uniref:hypothetical protein n=1 Tax=Shewanella sp. FJAT-52076 TaxID=2864202 RepID=UPI001C65F2FD|nr:hypothetical protein [Shewanella sp. FJAT-52076]QYJ75062.1 hypothetical protein K0H79_17240 [Shewanella sp. FJAT-52076]
MSNLMCFKIGWAALLDVELWLKWLDILSKIATVVAVVVAIIAAFIAYKQITSNSQVSKSSTAISIYQQYLQLCIDNPQFSMGMQKPTNRTGEYTKYCWFVSSMLYSFEQILEVYDNDDKWIKTIKSQLIRHSEHLKISSSVQDGHWNSKLESVIEDVLHEI